MPWHIENDNPDCDGYAVVKDDDGQVVGCHDTLEEAEGQLSALYASEENALRPNWERRYFDISELRLEQQDGHAVMQGYAAVFNSMSENLGGFYETIEPGAFDAYLGGDVRALWQHDVSQVLGRTKAGTLRLAEDEVGLQFEVDLPQSADAIVETLRRGDVDQMSFGFRTIEDHWIFEKEKEPLRKLVTVELYEISPVTFPAYEATSVGLRKQEIYGYIPDIPANRAAAGARPDANSDTSTLQARARRANRRRRLQLWNYRR